MSNPSLSRPSLPAPTWRPDRRHAGWAAAMLWVLIVLMIAPEGLDYAGLDSRGAPESAGALSRLLWLGVGLVAVAIGLWRLALAGALLRVLNPWLLPFVLLALVSLAWSIDPGLSLRRLYRLLTIVLACTAFVLVGWHAQRFQRVLRPAITLLLAGSLVFGLLAPELAIHAQTAAELVGAWRGLATHKNGLGTLAGLGLLLWLHAALTRQAGALAVCGGLLLSATCLLLSRSSTSLVAAAVGAAVLLLALRWPRAWRGVLPVLILGAAVALLIAALGLIDLLPGGATLSAPIAALSGKDGSLTGRTGIWAVIAEHVQLRPLLGSGYGAYWTATPTAGTDAFEVTRRLDAFYPGSSHNGYLEVLNDLGAAGLLLLLAYLLTHVVQSLRLLRLAPAEGAQAVLYLALFFQQAIGNLSETHWFAVQSVDFVFMTLTSLALARSLLAHRLRVAWGVPARKPDPASPAVPTHLTPARHPAAGQRPTAAGR